MRSCRLWAEDIQQSSMHLASGRVITASKHNANGRHLQKQWIVQQMSWFLWPCEGLFTVMAEGAIPHFPSDCQLGAFMILSLRIFLGTVFGGRRVAIMPTLHLLSYIKTVHSFLWDLSTCIAGIVLVQENFLPSGLPSRFRMTLAGQFIGWGLPQPSDIIRLNV